MAGKFTALTLVAALVALAAPALAEPLPVSPPGLPGLPTPPATAGRCVAAAQDFFNSGTPGMTAARDASLVALDHQRTASTAAFSAITTAAIPDYAMMNATLQGVVRASNASAGPLGTLPGLVASGLGPALNLTVNGLGTAGAEMLPAMARQVNVSLPWTGARVSGALQPLVEWNDRTTYSMLLRYDEQLRFFNGYAVSQANGPAPPLEPTYSALASASTGAGKGSEGLGLLSAGVGNASDAMLQATLDLADPNSPAGGGVLGIANAIAAETRQGAGAMAGHAQGDGGSLTTALRSAATGWAARAQGLPSEVAACPRTS